MIVAMENNAIQRDRKQAMRRMIRQKRKLLDKAWILDASKAIQESLLASDEFADAEVIACYMALPYEVQTNAILQASWECNKNVLVPAFNENASTFSWTRTSRNDATSKGKFDVLEPEDKIWAVDAPPELIITPGVAYDTAGRRLGHGGGHFDRLLCGEEGLKVGLAFQFQIVDSVPFEDHDIPVDVVMTEECTYFITEDFE